MEAFQAFLEKNPFRLTEAGVLMAVWGTLVLLGGVIVQWVPLNSLEAILAVWAVVTIVGLFVQGVSQWRHKKVNFIVWLAAIAVGWSFTLYAVYADGSVIGYLAGIWLLLVGLGNVQTALDINTRFFYLAGLNLVFGLLSVLSAAQVVRIQLLDHYAALVLGVVAGASLLIGAAFTRRPMAQPAQEQPLDRESPAVD